MISKHIQSPRLLELIDRITRVLESERRADGLNATQRAALYFLSRANQFSRNPTAVAAWLRQTKGTVSQTLTSLESKGLIQREAVPGDKRSVRFLLTKLGIDVVASDPIKQLAGIPEEFDRSRLSYLEEELAVFLRHLLEARDGKTFAECSSCRHFCTDDHKRKKYHCGLLDVPLSVEDSQQICVEHEYPAA